MVDRQKVAELESVLLQRNRKRAYTGTSSHPPLFCILSPFPWQFLPDPKYASSWLSASFLLSSSLTSSSKEHGRWADSTLRRVQILKSESASLPLAHSEWDLEGTPNEKHLQVQRPVDVFFLYFILELGLAALKLLSGDWSLLSKNIRNWNAGRSNRPVNWSKHI